MTEGKPLFVVETSTITDTVYADVDSWKDSPPSHCFEVTNF